LHPGRDSALSKLYTTFADFGVICFSFSYKNRVCTLYLTEFVMHFYSLVAQQLNGIATNAAAVFRI